jgi:hypothetical protein
MLPTASGTSTPTRTLPGPKTIITAACRLLCAALTSQLFVNRAHVAVGSARKILCLAFYEQTIGILPTLQPAIMGLYVPYGNNKPWVKFEKFVLAGIVFNNAEYLRKVSSGAQDKVDHLKECAHQIVVEIEETMLKEGEEQLAVAEHASELCSTNKTAEYVMGLQGYPATDRVQEDAPYLDDVTDGHPVSALGPRLSFHVVSKSFHILLSLH